MLELVFATVDYFGLADPVIDGFSGIQTTAGKRSAVCKTADGRKFHIRDWSWAKVQSWRLKVPQFKSRNKKFIQDFPSLHAPVYALVDFSVKGARGAHPDAKAWCVADRYELGLKIALAPFHVWNQDDVVAEIRKIVARGYHNKSIEQCAEETDTLNRLIWQGTQSPYPYERHEALISCVQHYVHGRPPGEINGTERSAA